MAEGMSRDTATKANYFSRNPDELRRREESVGMFRINDIIQLLVTLTVQGSLNPLL